MVSPALVPVLWAVAILSLVAAFLFFRLLKSGFELRRANLFLQFGNWEPYFAFVSASILFIIALEFAYLVWMPDELDLFPDAVILLIVHAGAVLVYLRVFLLLGEKRGRA
jgi:hypothetical protein